MPFIILPKLDIEKIICWQHRPQQWPTLSNKFITVGFRVASVTLFETNWTTTDTSSNECLAAIKEERIIILKGDKGGELIGCQMSQSDRSWADYTSQARNTIIKNNSYLFNSITKNVELNNVTLIDSEVTNCKLKNCIVRNSRLIDCNLEGIILLDKKWKDYNVTQKPVESVKQETETHEDDPLGYLAKFCIGHESCTWAKATRQPDALLIITDIDDNGKVRIWNSPKWICHRESVENFIHKTQRDFDLLSHEDKKLIFSKELQEKYI